MNCLSRLFSSCISKNQYESYPILSILMCLRFLIWQMTTAFTKITKRNSKRNNLMKRV